MLAEISSGRFHHPKRGWPWAQSAHATNRRTPWGLKLYVCVGSRDYWRCVSILQKEFPGDKHRWKFFFGADLYERPDKIVFYFDSLRHLKYALPRLRKKITGMSPRSLDHAMPTGGHLEAPGMRGLYIACDPNFLRTSWRLYRVLVLAWAAKNARYLRALPGGLDSWFQRMNISTSHDGPATLRPSSRDFAYVRRYWRLIDPRGVTRAS